jgi:DNA-binding response OmpR family regulator
MASPTPRILYVEDHTDTRKLITIVLTKQDFQVDSTDDQEQALNLARKEQFDLYLLDFWMPHVSGLELCMRLREFEDRTPILFYSADTNEADKKRAFAAGADGYLVKPTDTSELVAEVSRLIASRHKDS